MNKREFAEEYSTLRSWGLSHDKIADRLGVKRGSLLRRLGRNGIAYLPEPGEREYVTAIDAMIASGREFLVRDVPVPEPRPAFAVWVMRRALAEGRVVRVRRVGTHTRTHRFNVYRGVAAEQAVAS